MEEVCRVCLNKSGSMIHIFDGTHELDVSIADMISKWSGFPVERGDSQPKYICQHCLKNAKLEYGSGQTYEDRHQLLCQVKEENISEGDIYRITDIEDRRSYLIEVKAEAPEDEVEETEIHALLDQVKDEPIVEELLSEQEPESETAQVKNEESDEDLLEKSHRGDDIDVSQYRTTDKKRPFKCPDCVKSFAFPSDIKRHMRSHERKRLKLSQAEEKPYICSHCSKRFGRKDHLTEHVSTHAEERPYRCSKCEKTFKTNAYLKRHIRLHTEERPHKCSLCEMAFMTTSDLKRHNRTHSADRPCKCVHCPKTFQTEADLKRHSWSHMGELPYSCPQCPKSYLHLASLVMHMDMHKKKPHMCSHCPMSFLTEKILNKHMETSAGH